MNKINKIPIFLILILGIGIVGLVIPSKAAIQTQNDPIGTINMGSVGSKLTPKEVLGKQLFFDKDLSTPPGQSCAFCHSSEVGWTGPDEKINAHGAVYPGAVHNLFGNRKPPSAAYGGDSPVLYFDINNQTWVGGMFWDSRATGKILGDPLAEQAQGPFLNPLEQNNANATDVCIKVSESEYAGLFEKVWGKGSLNCVNNVSGTYERIARSIAAYERSIEVSQFGSTYDEYLKTCVDKLGMSKKDACLIGTGDKKTLDPENKFTHKEWKGLQLFMAPTSNNGIKEPGEGGNCVACHPPPLFTDFTHDNLGVPKNPQNPFYNMPSKYNPDGKNFIDYGLGGFLKTYDPTMFGPELGRQKVPTLRNVDKRPYPAFVKAYSHNGYFKSLEEIVHFYNARDVPGAGWKGVPWPAPEVPATVNKHELGNLGLTSKDEAAIVAFMKTLTDRTKHGSDEDT
ncbi:MAG: cytochrome c peroxidase [Candidatus Methanoperedens sp.]|nr:cytochrome C [Candidatus Methanoperedens sp.]